MSLLNTIFKNKLFITLLFLTIILIICQYFQKDIYFNRNDINHGQWWKLFSGHFTHSNYPHLLLNLAGLWILGLLFIDTFTTKTFILSNVFLTIMVGYGLFYFSPELSAYYGYSGVLYGLYLVGAVSAILKKDFFTGYCVAILICGKTLWDAIFGGSQASADLIGVPVANDAHLYGVIGAIALSVFLYVIWYLSLKKDTPPLFKGF